MWRVVFVVVLIVSIAVGSWVVIETTKQQPYEDLTAVAQKFNDSKLKERHSEFLIKSQEDVRFIQMTKGPDAKYRVEYGKSLFYLYEDTMRDETVILLLDGLKIKVGKDKEGNTLFMYDQELKDILIEL